MALLKLNTARNVMCLIPRFTVAFPADCILSKDGAAFGAPLIGVCSTIGVGGLYDIGVLALTSSDTDTLGDLLPVIYAGGGSWCPAEAYQVVPYLPGQDVDNVRGNVLGNLSAVSQIDVANTLLDLADSIELGLTLRDALKVFFAVLGGVSLPSPGQVKFRNFGDTKTRVTAQISPSGGRPAVTCDFT